MLVDENDANIFSFLCKSVEGCLDGRCVGFAVYNKEVLLSIGASRDVLSRKVSFCIDEAQWLRDTHSNTCKKQTCYRVLDRATSGQCVKQRAFPSSHTSSPITARNWRSL